MFEHRPQPGGERFRRAWFRRLTRILGPLPEHYLVLDTETLDFRADTLIVEVGYCVVRARQVVYTGSELVHPLQGTGLTAAGVQQRMEKTAAGMRRNGRTYQMEFSTLVREGRPAADVFADVHTLLQEARQQGLAIVGHGFWMFDAPRILYHLQRYVPQAEYVWREQEIFDTEALVRASQMGDAGLPRSGETPAAWAQRIRSRRVKIQSNIHFALAWLQLEATLGAALAQLHTAATDCYATHLIFEACRSTGAQETET